MEKVGDGGIYQCCAFFFLSFSATQAVRDLARCCAERPVAPTRIMSSKLVTKDNGEKFDLISAQRTVARVRAFLTAIRR